MGSEAEPADLNRIRGWLLVSILVLVPHAVGAVVALLFLDRSALGGTLSVATLFVTALGNLLGISLALSRHRLAPAFFTLYPLLLLGLTLLDRDLLGTVNARRAALGIPEEMSPVLLGLLLAVNIAIVALMVGYWTRSQRVRAVFGSTGLELLRDLIGRQGPFRRAS